MNLRDNHRLENRTLIIKGEYNLAIGKQRAQAFEAKKKNQQKTLGLNFSPITFATPSVATCMYCYLGHFDNIAVMNPNPHSLNV